MDDVPQLSEHMRLLKVEDAFKLATQFFEERILKLGLFFASLIYLDSADWLGVWNQIFSCSSPYLY